MAQRQYSPRGASAATPNAKGEKPQLRLVVNRASDVRMRAVRWLWKDQIPLGKLTLIAGEAKIGKSQISADLAACVSAQKCWPDGSRCEQGLVLVLSAEDDEADTIVPRLVASGAEREWVDIVSGLSTSDGKRACFDFAAGFDALRDYAEENPELKLVIIDPVMAYMGRRDAHKAAEVRDALMPYTELAAARGFAIVAITHLNRGTSTDAFQRVLGSGAFAQIARMNFLVAHDAEEEDRRLLIPFGGNLAPLGDAFAYRIASEQVEGDEGPIDTSRVVWQKERVAISAHEALKASAEGQNAGGKIEEACDHIREALSGRRAMESEALKDHVISLGVKFGTYKKARAKLKDAEEIRTWKGTGDDLRWFVELVRGDA